jgi:hypothetical protein
VLDLKGAPTIPIAAVQGKAKSIQIKIEAESFNPRKRIFFTHFSIDRTSVPEFYVFRFWFSGIAGELVDDYCCVVGKDHILGEKQNFLRFYEALPKPDDKKTATPQPRRGSSCVEPVDLIGMAHRGNEGEIVLHSYSWKMAIDQTNQKEDVEKSSRAIFVALLRCPISVLKDFIKSIYK